MTFKIYLALVALVLIAAANPVLAGGGKRISNPSREEMQKGDSAGYCAYNGKILVGTNTVDAVLYPSCVRQALFDKEDVNQRWSGGFTPLFYIALFADRKSSSPLTSAHLLLHAGAKVDLANNRGETPLQELVETCRPDESSACLPMAKLFLSYGANPMAESHSDDTSINSALKWATYVGRKTMIKQMLVYMKDVDQLDRTGQGPLHYIVKSIGLSTEDRVELISYLVSEREARIDNRSGTALTPLQTAVSIRSGSMVEALIDAGADLNANHPKLGTALHVAASRATPEMTRALVLAGAKIDAVNSAGATALHIAASAGRTDNLTALIELGADPLAKDKAGRTIADYAEIHIGINSQIDTEEARKKIERLKKVLEILAKYTKTEKAS